MYILGNNLTLISTFNEDDFKFKLGLDVVMLQTNRATVQGSLSMQYNDKISYNHSYFIKETVNFQPKKYLIKFNAFTWKIETLLNLTRLGFYYCQN